LILTSRRGIGRDMNSTPMTRTILRFGAASGAITIGSAILALHLVGGGSKHLASLEWLGYLVMILAFGVIFVGVKRHRDDQLGGVIRFGQAFLVGLGITAVASAIYVIAWEINLAFSDVDFIGQYTASALETARTDGASEAELEAMATEMAEMKEAYAKPLFRVFITFSEIFPVGLLVSLIAAAVLRTRG
jgi:hypothetical protein